MPPITAAVKASSPVRAAAAVAGSPGGRGDLVAVLSVS